MKKITGVLTKMNNDIGNFTSPKCLGRDDNSIGVRKMIRSLFDTKRGMNKCLEKQVLGLKKQVDKFKGTLLEGRRQEKSGRGRRGLIDLGGDIGKALFGIATTDDVEEVTKKVNTLMDTSKEILHLQQQQATVMRASMKEIGSNRRAINKLVTMSRATLEDLEKTKLEVGRLLRITGSLTVLSSSMVDTQALQEQQDMIAMAIDVMHDELNMLITAIEVLSSNRLSSYFLPSDREISLAKSFTVSNLWRFTILHCKILAHGTYENISLRYRNFHKRWV